MIKIHKIDSLNACDRIYTKIYDRKLLLSKEIALDKTYLSISRKLINKIQIKKVGLVQLAVVDIKSIYTEETKDCWCLVTREGGLLQAKLDLKLLKAWWGCFVFIHND